MKKLLLLFIIALLPGTAGTLPKLSLSQLVDSSSAVLRGRVTRHWSAWDADHQLIWTHYEVRTSEVFRGRNAPSYTISEPGGVIGELGLRVSNSVPFADEEEVIVFLKRMPNGMLRVSGGTQGKLRVVNTFAGQQLRGQAHIVQGLNLEEFAKAIRSAKSQQGVK